MGMPDSTGMLVLKSVALLQEGIPLRIASIQFAFAKQPDTQRGQVKGDGNTVGENGNHIEPAVAGVGLEFLNQSFPVVALDEVETTMGDDQVVFIRKPIGGHICNVASDRKTFAIGQKLQFADAGFGNINCRDIEAGARQGDGVATVAAAEIEHFPACGKPGNEVENLLARIAETLGVEVSVSFFPEGLGHVLFLVSND